MSNEMPLATVTVSSNAYPVSAQVTPAFAPSGYALVNTSPTVTVFFTFNRTGGATVDQGVLLPGGSVPVSYASIKQSLWLRTKEATGSALVYVMAAG